MQKTFAAFIYAMLVCVGLLATIHANAQNSSLPANEKLFLKKKGRFNALTKNNDTIILYELQPDKLSYYRTKDTLLRQDNKFIGSSYSAYFSGAELIVSYIKKSGEIRIRTLLPAYDSQIENWNFLNNFNSLQRWKSEQFDLYNGLQDRKKIVTKYEELQKKIRELNYLEFKGLLKISKL